MSRLRVLMFTILLAFYITLTPPFFFYTLGFVDDLKFPEPGMIVWHFIITILILFPLSSSLISGYQALLNLFSKIFDSSFGEVREILLKPVIPFLVLIIFIRITEKGFLAAGGGYALLFIFNDLLANIAAIMVIVTQYKRLPRRKFKKVSIVCAFLIFIIVLSMIDIMINAALFSLDYFLSQNFGWFLW